MSDVKIGNISVSPPSSGYPFWTRVYVDDLIIATIHHEDLEIFIAALQHSQRIIEKLDN